MRKTLALFIALLFALSAIGASAEEPVQMRIVKCPEQGFSTLCRPEYDYYFHPDGGLTIWLGEPEVSSSVTMFKTDAPGSDFDSEYYFRNVYSANLASSYGDDLIDPGEYTVYSLGGRQMPGQMSMYMVDGEVRLRFCAYDLRDDCFVRYDGVSGGADSDIEQMLTAVAVAVGNFQPDPDYYSSAQ